MTLSIKNCGYAFLIRLDLIFSMSLWKEFQLLQILNDLLNKFLTASVYGTPKMHKISSSDSFPKLRPIVSSVGTFN